MEEGEWVLKNRAISSRLRSLGLSAVVSLAFGSGCAHSLHSGGETRGENDRYQDQWIVRDQEAAKKVWVVSGVTLENVDFDIPMRVNSHVEKWIEYFTGRGRVYFQTYLDRSEHFIPFIEPILKEEKLPLDLVYLAMIESGFNTRARSRARAVGAWQFIRATGRRYGLNVTWWVDERKNIAKSTRAAAHYLKDLFRHFRGNWELALSAYNAGEMKVARAIRRYGTTDFWSLIRHRFLRPETRNYVPKLMAAAILAKNRTLFGFTPPKMQKVDPLMDRAIALADDGSEVTVESLGAGENSASANEPSEPNEEEALLAEFEKEYKDGALPAKVIETHNSEVIREYTPHVSRSGEVGNESLIEVEVKGPADLLQIAKAAGLSYRIVKKLNPEILRWMTPPGSDRYVVKLPIHVKSRFLIAYNHPAFPREIEFRKYKIRKGDHLRRIARRFGISQRGIADLNGITTRSRLIKGDYLILPLPADRSRSIASLDLRDPPRRRYRYRKRAQTKKPQKNQNAQHVVQKKAKSS